jgi:hypothetical protein
MDPALVTNMKLPSTSAILLFVGLALFAGGVAVPTAQASCLLVVGGTCGTGCDPTSPVNVGCGSQDCDVVVLSDCVPSNSGAPGSCIVTVIGPDPRNDCGGSCEVNVGFCDFAGATNDGPANCTVTVGTCLGNGDCTVNVAYSNAPAPANGNCNGDCLVNLVGSCSSVGPGTCTVNLGICQGNCAVNGPLTDTCFTGGQCAVNLGLCYGRCTVNLDTCSAGEVCTLQFGICRLP